MSKNRGFTLIELLAVLTIMSLIAAMATSILFSMLQQRAAMETQMLVANSHLRLAERFREDVQQAQSFDINGSRFQLSGLPGTVTYERVAPQTMRRTVEIENRPRHDDFELLEDHLVAFSSEPLADRTMIWLRVTPPSATYEAGSVPQPLAISSRGLTTVSELARDHRWKTREVQP